MKYSQAEKKIKDVSSKYKVDMDDGEFYVSYNGVQFGACVSKNNQYSMNVGCPESMEMPKFDKVYEIVTELAMTPLDERVEEKKYYIKIFDGSHGFLNFNTINNRFNISDEVEFSDCQTKFTDKEIEELKQRDDIPIDWEKVHFKDAE